MGRKGRFLSQKIHIALRLAAIALPGVLVLATLSLTAFAKTVADQSAVTDSELLSQESGTVQISYHGQRLRTSASGETVEELLAALGLTVEEGDVLSHPTDTQVFDGMQLRIDAVITREETYTAVLRREVTVCNDASIPSGSTEVLVEGRDGEVLRTAQVTYINGAEIERKVLGEIVTIQPVTQIVAAGTGAAPEAVDPNGMPVIGDGYIILPTGEVLTYTRTDTVRATAYTHTDAGCDMITATGSVVHKGTVAVDPRFVPYGTRMFIVANDGSYVYGVAEAEDCGGAIKRDRMDLYFPTYDECMAFGWRTCTVYFLG